MTRHPRAKASGADAPHELLPTLRLPPVEARAMRREAELAAAAKAKARDDAGSPDAPTPAVSTGAASVETDDDAAFDASAVAGTPTAPVEDARERAPTLRVQALPQAPAAPTRLGRMARHPGARRPPLPLPDVLRQGPMPAMKTHVGAAPTAPTPTSGRAPVLTPPEQLPEIDTAALVVDLTASLVAMEEPAAPPVVETVDAASQPVAPPPSTLVEPPSAAPRASPSASPSGAVVASPLAFELPSPAARTEVSTGAHTLAITPPRRSLRGVVTASAALVAVVLAGWWLVRPQPHALEPAASSELPSQLAAASPAVTPALARDAAPAPAVIEPVAPPPAAPPIEAPIDAPVPEQAVEVVEIDADADAPAQLAEPAPAPPSDLPPPPPTVEAAPAPVAAPEPASVATKPAASSKGRKTSKGRKASKPASSKPASSKPAAVAAAAPSKPAAGPDRLALLREAEQAFAQGRYATALRNAERSLSLGNDVRAGRIAALSACKLKRADAARRAFERMPLGQRRGIRNSCNADGVKL